LAGDTPKGPEVPTGRTNRRPIRVVAESCGSRRILTAQGATAPGLAIRAVMNTGEVAESAKVRTPRPAENVCRRSPLVSDDACTPPTCPDRRRTSRYGSFSESPQSPSCCDHLLRGIAGFYTDNLWFGELDFTRSVERIIGRSDPRSGLRGIVFLVAVGHTGDRRSHRPEFGRWGPRNCWSSVPRPWSDCAAGLVRVASPAARHYRRPRCLGQ